MGQYYNLVNVDKQITVEHNFKYGGTKLLEYSYLNNLHAIYLRQKLNKAWRGDRILHIGDYCGAKDKTTTEKTIKKMVKEGVLKTDNNKTQSVILPEKEIKMELNHEKDYRYICNIDKKECIDIERTIPEIIYADIDKDGKKCVIGSRRIDPLLLLIACGNGQGGGDYPEDCVNYDKVGYWAGDHLFSTNNTSDLKEYHVVDYYFEVDTKWINNLDKYFKELIKDMKFYNNDGFRVEKKDLKLNEIEFTLKNMSEDYKEHIIKLLEKEKIIVKK